MIQLKIESANIPKNAKIKESLLIVSASIQIHKSLKQQNNKSKALKLYLERP